MPKLDTQVPRRAGVGHGPIGHGHIKLNSFSSAFNRGYVDGTQNTGSSGPGTHFVNLPVFPLINTWNLLFIPVFIK
jgi:hypothetical protein